MKRSHFFSTVGLTLMLFSGFIFQSCGKKTIVVADNDAPYYDGISTERINNYINKLYIDLIGREPLATERDSDVAYMRSNNLSLQSRVDIVDRLQTDTSWVDGDTSYTISFFRRFYELSKVRLLEGISDDELVGDLGIVSHAAFLDSLLGDWVGMERNLVKVRLYKNVLNSRKEFQLGEIEVNEMFKRMLLVPTYNVINMNTFNLINASFNDLLFRFPTDSEIEVCEAMIEFNQSGTLFSVPGGSYQDYSEIITSSREFYEGMIYWAYLTYLAREPGSLESGELIPALVNDPDILWLIRGIVSSDEYANF